MVSVHNGVNTSADIQLLGSRSFSSSRYSRESSSKQAGLFAEEVEACGVRESSSKPSESFIEAVEAREARTSPSKQDKLT